MRTGLGDLLRWVAPLMSLQASSLREEGPLALFCPRPVNAHSPRAPMHRDRQREGRDSGQLPWPSESGCGPCRESQAPRLGGGGWTVGGGRRRELGTRRGFLEARGLALGLRRGRGSAGQGGGLGPRGTANAWSGAQPGWEAGAEPLGVGTVGAGVLEVAGLCWEAWDGVICAGAEQGGSPCPLRPRARRGFSGGRVTFARGLRMLQPNAQEVSWARLEPETGHVSRVEEVKLRSREPAVAAGPPLSRHGPRPLGLGGSSLVSPGLTAPKPLRVPVWGLLAWARLQEAGGPSSLAPFSSCHLSTLPQPSSRRVGLSPAPSVAGSG